MNCDSEANITVSQIMVEMVVVASFHTTGTRAESHRQNVVVPIRQIQDDMVKVIQLIHKNVSQEYEHWSQFHALLKIRHISKFSQVSKNYFWIEAVCEHHGT